MQVINFTSRTLQRNVPHKISAPPWNGPNHRFPYRQPPQRQANFFTQRQLRTTMEYAPLSQPIVKITVIHFVVLQAYLTLFPNMDLEQETDRPWKDDPLGRPKRTFLTGRYQSFDIATMQSCGVSCQQGCLTRIFLHMSSLPFPFFFCLLFPSFILCLIAV